MHDAIARDVTTRDCNSKLAFLISARKGKGTKKPNELNIKICLSV